MINPEPFQTEAVEADRHSYCGLRMQLPTKPFEATIRIDANGKALVACFCIHCKIAVWLNIDQFRAARKAAEVYLSLMTKEVTDGKVN